MKVEDFDRRLGLFKHHGATFIRPMQLTEQVRDYERQLRGDKAEHPIVALARLWLSNTNVRAPGLRVVDLPKEVQAEIVRLRNAE